MRITGGRARNIRLQTGAELPGFRPATDRLREAVFSHLGPFVEGARVLDLFAGTGSVGLEALSRGAAAVTWVEQDRRLTKALEANLAAVRKSLGEEAPPESACRIARGDVLHWEPPMGTLFDLLFCDPPYALLPAHGTALFAKMALWLAPEGRVIAEVPGGYEVSAPGWEQLRALGKTSRVGGPVATVWRRASA